MLKSSCKLARDPSVNSAICVVVLNCTLDPVRSISRPPTVTVQLAKSRTWLSTIRGPLKKAASMTSPPSSLSEVSWVAETTASCGIRSSEVVTLRQPSAIPSIPRIRTWSSGDTRASKPTATLDPVRTTLIALWPPEASTEAIVTTPSAPVTSTVMVQPFGSTVRFCTTLAGLVF